MGSCHAPIPVAHKNATQSDTIHGAALHKAIAKAQNAAGALLNIGIARTTRPCTHAHFLGESPETCSIS
jgi:hypothetical protein